MPALAHPCISGVEMSKHAGQVLALWMHTQNQSPVAAILAKKKAGLSNMFIIVDLWMINTYHHTKPELRKKNISFIFKLGPLRP